MLTPISGEHIKVKLRSNVPSNSVQLVLSQGISVWSIDAATGLGGILSFATFPLFLLQPHIIVAPVPITDETLPV